MCYNIAFIEKKLETLAKRFNAGTIHGPIFHPPLFHASAFKHPYWPVLLHQQEWQIDFYRWGLIPSFTKDWDAALKISTMTGNCIGEEAFEKPSFRKPIRTNRCVIPVSGFYEWRTENGVKYPYYIFPKNDEFFFLGGIFDEWTNPENNDLLKTFSIITCEANPLLAKIHNTKKRMPLILSENNLTHWLQPDLQREDVLSMITPYDNDLMQAHTISRKITDRKNYVNDESLIQEFTYPELQLLDAFD